MNPITDKDHETVNKLMQRLDILPEGKQAKIKFISKPYTNKKKDTHINMIISFTSEKI